VAAASANPTDQRKLPSALLGGYLLLFAACAIAPYDRAVWWAENLPIVAVVAALVIMHVRGIRLSNLGYAFASVLLFLHTIGGHYTFERVPFELVTHALGTSRNHYDRIAHFSVGFYAFGMAELLETRGLVTKRWIACTYGVFTIGSIAAIYEIIEWLYAALEGGSAGAAFLGSQGDVWDAQKDMLADLLGACFAVSVYALRRRFSAPPAPAR
jgi:putative membrane protein